MPRIFPSLRAVACLLLLAAAALAQGAGAAGAALDRAEAEKWRKAGRRRNPADAGEEAVGPIAAWSRV